MEKVCTKCQARKSAESFPVESRRKNGRLSQCKDCINAFNRGWRKAHPEKAHDYSKAWREANPEKNKARTTLRNLLPSERERKSEWRKKNPEYCTRKSREWARKNRALIIQRDTERKRRDPGYYMRRILSSRLCQSLKSRGLRKRKTTMQLLGCTIPELKAHIASRFRDGMSWDNRGTHWHVDHIIPCCKFDLTDEEEQKKCFHFSNLQPLLVHENLAKGGRA